MATPSTIDRTGRNLAALVVQLDLPSLDDSLLSNDVVGHAGLAQALRDYTEQWNRYMQQLRSHLDAAGEQTRRAGLNYQQVDQAAAGRLTEHSDGTG
jgi:hypothetical protein